MTVKKYIFDSNKEEAIEKASKPRIGRKWDQQLRKPGKGKGKIGVEERQTAVTSKSPGTTKNKPRNLTKEITSLDRRMTVLGNKMETMPRSQKKSPEYRQLESTRGKLWEKYNALRQLKFKKKIPPVLKAAVDKTYATLRSMDEKNGEFTITREEFGKLYVSAADIIQEYLAEGESSDPATSKQISNAIEDLFSWNPGKITPKRVLKQYTMIQGYRFSVPKKYRTKPGKSNQN